MPHRRAKSLARGHAGRMGLFDKLLGKKDTPDSEVSDERMAQVMRSATETTGIDHELAMKMLAGAMETIHHERELEEGRGAEAMVARLVPQLPIRGGDVRSWLGGGAALPAGTAWPEQEGQRAMHLATISLADLPPELWGGRGPRTGWLVFFMHFETYDVQVLHVTSLGELVEAPEPSEDVFAPAHGMRLRDEGPKPIRAFPRWPIDIVAVTPGDDDPIAVEGGRDSLYAEYKAGYDVSTPEYRPFDWPTTLVMVDLMEPALEQRAKVARSWAEKLEGEPKQVFERAVAAWDVALPRVRHIASQLRSLAASSPFSDDLVSPLLEQLREIEWIEVRRPTANEAIPLPLRVTEHHADASLWVHKFENVRFDWAKHAYVKDPASLPPAIRAHYEAKWRASAAGDMPSMGHVPIGYVHDFDDLHDDTLLELPSSGLMSWMFGDVNTLVITATKAALAAGSYEPIKVQWSN